MGHGRANNFEPLPLSQGARTPGPAKDRPVLLDAMACARRLAAAVGARASAVVFRATRVVRSSPTSAPSQFADVHDNGDRALRPVAVLGALFVYAVVLILLNGCQSPEPKTARPGLDRATGTAQSLQGQLDTIEYHARELRKGVK